MGSWGSYAWPTSSRRIASPAFVLHGSGRYAFACRLAGIPRRFGYGRGWQGWWLDGGATLARDEHHRHPIAMAIACSNAWDWNNPVSSHRSRFPVPPARPWPAVSGPSKTLGGLGDRVQRADRRWSETRFATLSLEIKPVFPTIFLLGGEAEREVATAIATHHPDEGCLAVIGEPIDEVAALLSDCGLFVGNDTGVYNLAAAVHTPAIGLFNGRYPPLAYSPFLSAITPAVPGSGMAGIGVDQVLAYVRSLGSA